MLLSFNLFTYHRLGQCTLNHLWWEEEHLFPNGNGLGMRYGWFTMLSQFLLGFRFMSTYIFKNFTFLLIFFRTTPTAYGISQARGQIGAAAASLHHSHSNTKSELCLQSAPQPQQHRILNPLSEARDWTHILMDPGWVLQPLSHEGNSLNVLLKPWEDRARRNSF